MGLTAASPGSSLLASGAALVRLMVATTGYWLS